jgi:hypothetical protein
MKTSRMRRPWPALGSSAIGNKKVENSLLKNTKDHGSGHFQGASTTAKQLITWSRYMIYA